MADFGLARLEQDAGMTMTGDLVGTLRYMSPEQAQGQRVLDERSDVYSLGVTLYEVLVLRPAFSGHNRQEILRHITSDEPRPPRQVNPRIPRDLETIVLRAIGKEPTSRYQSAAALADDLKRFLNDQPIQARRPRFAEKCVRWSRRHPAVALSAVTIACVIAIASSTAALLINGAKNDAVAAQELERQARERADQQSELALKTLNLVVRDIQSKLAQVPGAQKVRQSLLDTAIEGLQHVARTLSTTANADHSLVQSHLDLGDTFMLTGELKNGRGTELALEHYRTAHEVAASLAERHPHEAQFKRDLAITCSRLCEVNLQLGNVAAARDWNRMELEISRKMLDENPQSADARQEMAIAHQWLGNVNLKLGNVAAARAAYQDGIDICQKSVDEDPHGVEPRRFLAVFCEKLGNLSLEMGNLRAAREAYLKELEITAAIARDTSDDTGGFADLHGKLGKVDLRLGDALAARARFRRRLRPASAGCRRIPRARIPARLGGMVATVRRRGTPVGPYPSRPRRLPTFHGNGRKIGKKRSEECGRPKPPGHFLRTARQCKQAVGQRCRGA